MRAGLLLVVAGLLLGDGATAGRVGEGPTSFLSTASRFSIGVLVTPDTSRKVLAPDSVATPTAALAPDAQEKVTPRTGLRIVVAIAFLTVTTLLLYNVRSR